MAQPTKDETLVPKTRVVIRKKRDEGSRGVKSTAVSRTAGTVRDSKVMTQEEKSITLRTARKMQNYQERQDDSRSLRKLSNSQLSGPREKTESTFEKRILYQN